MLRYCLPGDDEQITPREIGLPELPAITYLYSCLRLSAITGILLPRIEQRRRFTRCSARLILRAASSAAMLESCADDDD